MGLTVLDAGVVIGLLDARVIATAASLDADELVTTDRRWPPRSRLGLRAVVTKL